MSVAFRRDGDDEHLEPRFEIPIPPGPNLVTRRGLDLIRARVAEIDAQLQDLAAAGADKPLIDAAARDLRYWQTREITAELVPDPDGETVEIGTRVTFLYQGRERSLAITGDDEADPSAGRIAFSAPLARALIGGEVGELRDFAGQAEAIEVRAIEVVGAGLSA